MYKVKALPLRKFVGNEAQVVGYIPYIVKDSSDGNDEIVAFAVKDYAEKLAKASQAVFPASEEEAMDVYKNAAPIYEGPVDSIPYASLLRKLTKSEGD